MDAADLANELAERERASALAALPPPDLSAGRPGECEECGRQYPRLIGGVCAPCRDYDANRNRG